MALLAEADRYYSRIEELCVWKSVKFGIKASVQYLKLLKLPSKAEEEESPE